MSTSLDRSPWAPGYRWWGALAIVIATFLFVNWAIAIGLLVVLLAQVARPFDFLLAFLLVVGGASFVFYEGGGLTYQLSLLSGAIVLMLICYVLADPGRAFSIPKTSLTLPLLTYVGLSLVNSARGVVAGHNSRFLGLELVAVLALGSALLVASVFEARRDLRLAVWGLVLVAFAGLGTFPITDMHTKGVYDAPVPGIVGLLLVNLSLRARTRSMVVGWIALSLPLFLHQFLTFGRGLWLGGLGGLVLSIVAFGGFGRGSGSRWARGGLVLTALIGLGLAGAVSVAVIIGQEDILTIAGTRFSSIGGTELSVETASNVFRLMEYSITVRHISEAPWFGHGLGYSFLGMSPIGFARFEQWYVHQNVLLVWLKQGIVGLGIFAWLMGSAMALGIREARRRKDPWESAWFATAAAGTVFLIVLGMTNFPFAKVNPTFLLALLWGGAMAMVRQGRVEFRWRPPGTPGRPRGAIGVSNP